MPDREFSRGRYAVWPVRAGFAVEPLASVPAPQRPHADQTATVAARSGEHT